MCEETRTGVWLFTCSYHAFNDNEVDTEDWAYTGQAQRTNCQVSSCPCCKWCALDDALVHISSLGYIRSENHFERISSAHKRILPDSKRRWKTHLHQKKPSLNYKSLGLDEPKWSLVVKVNYLKKTVWERKFLLGFSRCNKLSSLYDIATLSLFLAQDHMWVRKGEIMWDLLTEACICVLSH